MNFSTKRIKFLTVWHFSYTTYVEDIIRDHDSISEVIIDQTVEHQFIQLGSDDLGVRNVVKTCKKYNLPLTILTSTSTFNPSICNFDYPTVDCPTWWITKTLVATKNYKLFMDPQHQLIDPLDDSIGLGHPIEHLFISLNNASHLHRCIFIDILAKYDLIDLGAITWRDVSRNYDHGQRATFPEGTLESVLAGFAYKYWTPRRMLLDQPMDGTSVVPQQAALPGQYFPSFMQAVTESTADRFFITEKTAVPLLHNKLFLVLGSKNFHKNLATLGFELYDELFDYEFDDEDDVELRCEGIAQNVNKYRHKTMHELEQLTESVRDKITHNRKLAMQYALNPHPIFFEVADRLSIDDPTIISHLVNEISTIRTYH